MKNDKKIEKILETSWQVLRDLALPNGAIVAANTDHNYYPHTAKDYRYVWPRDAAYICIAADYLNEIISGAKISPSPSLLKREIIGIQEPYFKWLEERPEDFKKEGLLFQNYSTNGKKYAYQFQPDQMGITLWAVWHHFKNNISAAFAYEILIRRLADGLCNEWKGSYFFKNTSDIWEDGKRITSTKLENNFTYTLAACAGGLEKAELIFSGNENWKKTAKEMRKKIGEAYNKKEKYFFRNHGRVDDPNIDASMLGLVWPFEMLGSKDEKMINTVRMMEKKIVINGGVHRFKMDYYDGEGTAQEGAGAWPVLNFWMSIYWSLAGDRKKALNYFDWVLEKIGDDDLIPEQIYNDFRDGQGIKPLGWSHAMFIICYYFLFCAD